MGKGDKTKGRSGNWTKRIGKVEWGVKGFSCVEELLFIAQGHLKG